MFAPRIAEPTMVSGRTDREIAAWIAARIGAALETGHQVAIAVPGGSTPFPIFAELVALPLGWSRVTVWPGDDRIVDESHAASNVGRIRAVFEPAGARVVSLGSQEAPPHFALTWLGMGDDGHIASLFPNTDPQTDTPLRLVKITPDPLPPEAPFDRFSLTIPALLDSDALMFLIRGSSKRAVFEQAARGENDLPVARLLFASRQPVTCFC